MSFNGRRIALLEARLSDEAAALVRRLGGTPDVVPALREVVQPGRVRPFIERLSSGTVSMVIFLTGVGVAALLREAERTGQLEATLTALRKTRVVCRGPKPVAILKQHQVQVDVLAAEPYTTKDLLDALATVDLNGQSLALVHYGEPNERLAAALLARGARLDELSLYEWRLPDDLGPLKTLVQEIIDGRIDAVAFTSQIQCRHLFRVAGDLGLVDPLIQALRNTVVAAVGPVCAAALHELGVTPDVIPARPKMGPMITALSEYFDLTEGL
jgi:uroporphyrinogen-III synthase